MTTKLKGIKTLLVEMEETSVIRITNLIIRSEQNRKSEKNIFLT
jgi:hypothetical protein